MKKSSSTKNSNTSDNEDSLQAKFERSKLEQSQNISETQTESKDNADGDDEKRNYDTLKRENMSKRMRSKFDKKKKKEKRRVGKIFDEYLEKSGYDIKGNEFNRRIKISSIISGVILTIILMLVFHATTYKIPALILFFLISIVLTTAVSYIIIIIFALMLLDYKIYSRTKEIEEVLPEFLQLASANISAGMPIDRALWFAVRPKFGILAKEIEEVAKSTIAGEDLEEALENFTKKYDSKILKESINLLIEGMRAGGEIGFLLNQIASNMQDIKLMKKEIAASVMSYVIFITVAAIVGAPFLLALSAQLLVIMGSITSSMQFDDTGSSSSTFSMNISSQGIDVGDFRIFAVVVLILSAIFSAMIISVIRKGNTSESIKVIPGFILVSLLIFFAASALFGSLLGGLF